MLINDLNLCDIKNTDVWKHVDDTTTSQIITKGEKSNAQAMVDKIIHWSKVNRVKLNSEKCKELRISFFKYQRCFEWTAFRSRKEYEVSWCNAYK